jgi:hypothetical protein
MQAHPADECRAHASHCVEVAQHAPTLDDRSEFLLFAESWYRLADEIDIGNRLVAFIDGLPSSRAMENAKAEEIESGKRSLKRLTAAIVAISSSFMADQLGAVDYGGSEPDLAVSQNRRRPAQ